MILVIEVSIVEALREAKLATARFFFQRLLPKSSGHFAAIMAGKAPLMEMKEAAF
ncbi:acyl-CoA dehydrogenase C-terminal domain-containing protein [Pelagibius marinus]|uniref:acyl-CoA dehydrogenase C-terminal domain-containing protein n=1 Tax=Pelagibius marinus TaxID=2762760 RepID=UPI0029C9C198|nr:acyl-CoA dehydrogenase C-terminal domain-containing protein [Pelagibius marinus]